MAFMGPCMKECARPCSHDSHTLKQGYQGKGVGPKIHSCINVCSRSQKSVKRVICEEVLLPDGVKKI